MPPPRFLPSLYHTFSHTCKYNYAFYKYESMCYDNDSETRRVESTETYTNQHMEFSRRYMNYGTDYEDDPLRYLRQHRCYC